MGYDLCACGARKGNGNVRCNACRLADVIPPLNPSPAEIGWIAGILEGEGCWTTKQSNPAAWWVAVRMTDEDVITRLMTLTGVGTISIDTGREGHKPAWDWAVNIRSHREWLTVAVWPWLGERRRRRIRELWPEIDLYLADEASTEGHLASNQTSAGSIPVIRS